MSNSTPTHSPKLISERKKKKKKKHTEREENQEIGLVVHVERERLEGTEDRGHGIDVGAPRSARSNSDEG